MVHFHNYNHFCLLANEPAEKTMAEENCIVAMTMEQEKAFCWCFIPILGLHCLVGKCFGRKNGGHPANHPPRSM